MRPRTIADVVGQRHLLAPGLPPVAFASGKLHSMILWGPPGARARPPWRGPMADAFNAEFIALSAVSDGSTAP